MLRVRDIMTRGVISVASSTPVIDVAQQMKASKTGVIPVCDNRQFRGVITERDIVIGIVAAATNPATEPASSIMNHHPVVLPGEGVMQAAEVMVNNRVRMLAVAENGKLLGLFTLEDLARQSPALAGAVFSKTINQVKR